MATEMDVLSAINQLGFEGLGNLFYGTWKGYAVTLRKISAKTFYLDVAVRMEKVPAGLRRALARGIKEKGVRLGGIELINKKRVVFSVSFKGSDQALPRLQERLDAAAAALRENGISPADTCAISGAARPDSLCLVNVNGALCYQPVCAAAVREQGTQVRAKAEENEVNGSYAMGVLGAALGMLVGLIPNLLTIIYAEMISAWLFALVPICAMFGYKLFKGKMSRGSIVIVIVMSLLGVVLIPYLELVIFLVKDSGFTLGQAFEIAWLYMTQAEFLSEIRGEFLQLLLFMGLGILVAWRFMSNQTNGSAMQNSEAQLASLRPNPAYQENDAYRQV